jgi:tetratricopeptide (TPR) repeat protein
MLARLDRALPLLTGGRRDLPARQQTMRAAIEWSHDLLDPDGQRLLRRLAIFRGGWTLDAAETVCDADGALAGRVLDVLGELVDGSLVGLVDTDAEPRYTMLETVRELGEERLAAAGEADRVGRAHFDWLVAFAVAADPHLDAPDQAPWLARMLAEQDNVRAALDRQFGAGGDAMAAARLCAAYWRAWFLSYRLREAVRWLEPAWNRLPPDADAALQAELAYALGLSSAQLGDREGGLGRLADAVASFREIGDLRKLSWALLDLATRIMAYDPQDPRIRPLAEESLAVRRRLGNPYDVGMALLNLGEHARLTGDPGRATALTEEALALFDREDAAGTDFNRAIARINLGLLRLEGGRRREAAVLLADAMDLMRALDAEVGIALCVMGFGCMAAEDDQERAARLFGAGTARIDDAGYVLEVGERERFDRGITLARSVLDSRVWERAWAEGAGMTCDEAAAYARETS